MTIVGATPQSSIGTTRHLTLGQTYSSESCPQTSTPPGGGVVGATTPTASATQAGIKAPSPALTDTRTPCLIIDSSKEDLSNPVGIVRFFQ